MCTIAFDTSIIDLLSFKRFPLERKDLRITLFCLLLHLFCPSVAFRDRSESTTATLQDNSKSVLSFQRGHAPLLQKDPILDPLNALCLSKRFTAQTENHAETVILVVFLDRFTKTLNISQATVFLI